jgi:hypothetical protein
MARRCVDVLADDISRVELLRRLWRQPVTDRAPWYWRALLWLRRWV